MSWNHNQVRSFAKQLLAKDLEPAARPYLTAKVRRALVDSFVLTVVTTQDAATVQVAAVDQLRTNLLAQIETFTTLNFFL